MSRFDFQSTEIITDIDYTGEGMDIFSDDLRTIYFKYPKLVPLLIVEQFLWGHDCRFYEEEWTLLNKNVDGYFEELTCAISMLPEDDMALIQHLLGIEEYPLSPHGLKARYPHRQLDDVHFKELRAMLFLRGRKTKTELRFLRHSKIEDYLYESPCELLKFINLDQLRIKANTFAIHTYFSLFNLDALSELHLERFLEIAEIRFKPKEEYTLEELGIHLSAKLEVANASQLLKVLREYSFTELSRKYGITVVTYYYIIRKMQSFGFDITCSEDYR